MPPSLETTVDVEAMPQKRGPPRVLGTDIEKDGAMQTEYTHNESSDSSQNDLQVASSPPNTLKKGLQSRHMQMIAVGGSIGAGLFVSSGSALQAGGPASVLIAYIVVGIALLCTTQALGELTVLYPINGAFYTYIVRFVDPAAGFAIGWNYALGWLVVLPFELTASAITIQYWRDDINSGIWITVFLVLLCLIQVWGVRAYGEVEYILSIIKIVACLGFIVFGVVDNVGGVPTDTRGYIGGRYWHDPGAFQNGFKGFCTVFVNAAFAFGGTELVGLAAAEAADPHKSLPKATKQVFWRICFFYVLTLLIVGLIVPSNSPDLLGSSGADTKASPFVLAFQYAGVKGLPSVMNAVITISVISVANSCTYASSRTLQAIGEHKMGPRFFTYIDAVGRPLWCVVTQLLFGCLAYIGEAATGQTIFTWLLTFSAMSFFFLWGGINLAHIRFRAGWKAHGFTTQQLPLQASYGVWGSWVGLTLNIIFTIATFYTSLFPVGASPSAVVFLQTYIDVPVVLVLYLAWKIYSRQWTFWVKVKDMDVTTGMKLRDLDAAEPKRSLMMRVIRSII